MCELCVVDSSHAIEEEDLDAADDEDEDSDSNNNVPKGINRLSCKLLHRESIYYYYYISKCIYFLVIINNIFMSSGF